jgi:hypothetical protein
MKSDPHGNPTLSALAALRRFAKPRAPVERCELCDAPLADEHPHLVEPGERRLICACDPCALLFWYREGSKYRRVPRRVDFLPSFRLADDDWEALHLPINLAFFLHSSPAGRVVAFYPSLAGAMESLMGLEAWAELTEANPVLRELKPDVEALLVNRVGETREGYRVGVDLCYHLAGLIRLHWRGLAGGQAVWEEIARFFADLKERSRPAEGAAHA